MALDHVIHVVILALTTGASRVAATPTTAVVASPIASPIASACASRCVLTTSVHTVSARAPTIVAGANGAAASARPTSRAWCVRVGQDHTRGQLHDPRTCVLTFLGSGSQLGVHLIRRIATSLRVLHTTQHEGEPCAKKKAHALAIP